MADTDEPTGDDVLLGDLRTAWEAEDPVPAGLSDRMVAAIAVDDLNREFELLSIVEHEEAAAVRAADALRTVHFADAGADVLIRVSDASGGARRVNGWSTPPVLAARLAQAEQEWAADTVGDGRFAFDAVAPGRSRLRMVVQHDERLREVTTQWFDV